LGVRLDSRWFEEIVRPFEQDPSVDIVAGSYAVDQSTVQTAAARAEYYLTGGGIPELKPGFVPGNRSVAYTKKVWRELGGLPEDLTLYADDAVFGAQMVESDFKMAFAPKAMVYWARHRQLSAFWKEYFGYGQGSGEANIRAPIAIKLHRKHLIPRVFVVPLTAMRWLMVHLTFKGIRDGLKERDIVALVYMLPLVWGQGWHYAKGYLLGDARGRRECQACRARLRGNW
jgi:GT2 family glycosyltransferase